MRNLFIALIAFGLMSGCQKKPSTITFWGTDADVAGEDVKLYKSSDRTSYRQWTEALDTETVRSDGTFSLTYAAERPDFYQVVGAKGFPLFRDVYLEPGDSIHVIKFEEPDTRRFEYSGARSEAYACYDLLDSLVRNDTLYALDYYEIARMDADTARNVIRQKTSKKMAIVRDYFEGRPEWSVLEQKCREEIIYRGASERYDYLYYHNYYTRDTFVYLLPDSGYYDFLGEIDMASCPESYSFEYMHFLSAFLRDRVFHDYRDQSDSMIYANMLPNQLATAKKYLAGVPRDMAFLAIADDFSHHLWRDDFFAQVDSMELYLSTNHTSVSAYDGFKAVKSEFENLRPGNPAPELALPDINGDTVRLSEQKGKVVYLDFWGTWCYPCLQELPHSLTLQEKFADQPVEFIYVGLESGEDQLVEWKEFVTGQRSFSYAPFLEQRVYPGTHLLADGQFGNPAIQPFKIGAAPTYVLIDIEGRIISANAPRPSSDEIERLINTALVPGD